MLNFSPGDDLTHASLPAILYSQAPPVHSMISGAPVLKVRVDGRITPTDFLVPSANVTPWLMHLPSKYTLAWVATVTLLNFSVTLRKFSVALLEESEISDGASSLDVVIGFDFKRVEKQRHTVSPRKALAT